MYAQGKAECPMIERWVMHEGRASRYQVEEQRHERYGTAHG